MTYLSPDSEFDRLNEQFFDAFTAENHDLAANIAERMITLYPISNEHGYETYVSLMNHAAANGNIFYTHREDLEELTTSWVSFFGMSPIDCIMKGTGRYGFLVSLETRNVMNHPMMANVRVAWEKDIRTLKSEYDKCIDALEKAVRSLTFTKSVIGYNPEEEEETKRNSCNEMQLKLTLGHLYLDIGKYNKAIDIFEDTIKTYDSGGWGNPDELPIDQNVAASLINLGSIYLFTSRDKKALECYKKALCIFESTNVQIQPIVLFLINELASKNIAHLS